jgi:hypothetical protein
MKRSFIFFCASVFLVAKTLLGTTPVAPAPTVPVVASPDLSFAESKRNALDLAGGLINDGFRNRDGFWNLNLKQGQTSFLQVTLFQGNQYWFVAAAKEPAELLKITCYDHEGHPIKLDVWKDNLTVPGARKAAGFVAPKSGNYFIGLSLMESHGNAPADASLIYGYK